MCGIVGYVGTQSAAPILLEGLRRLEYRGYDSAGIATIWEGQLHRVRAEGKLVNLQSKLDSWEIPAPIGIGHTRWATHGKPEERNAHPHYDYQSIVAVVQNGIIENYRELRQELQAQGVNFHSETDTEVIPNLIARELAALSSSELETLSSPLAEAVRRAIARMEGGFAIAVLGRDYPDELVVARQQAPLVLGFGEGEFFCASDISAIVAHTRAIVTLESGEMAILTPTGISISDFAGRRLRKQPRLLSGVYASAEKQGFKHFMLKEIHEQPTVVRACLDAYLNPSWTEGGDSSGNPIQLQLSDPLLDGLSHVQILACGTSWHAGLIGGYLLEQLAGIPTTVHYASEFRYAPSPLVPNTLTIGVTQSGETADTLAAIEMEIDRRTARSQTDPTYSPRTLAITNRAESNIVNLVNEAILTPAGIEVGVAATKTFLAQVIAFYALALNLAHRRSAQPADRLLAIVEGLRHIPSQIEQILTTQEPIIEELAHDFIDTQDVIFIGRGINVPIALEGALKLKEISYIHAEGYPAGEMKHGPIALLEAKVPVIAIAMPGPVYDKVLSNAQEAKARDARMIGVLPEGHDIDFFDDVLVVGAIDELLSPLLTVIPLQLLSYHIAARRGLDVDQPRNLAKSVTVE
jgi:glutamine---fructose-6-phosphate transaminase (isomerizing)